MDAVRFLPGIKQLLLFHRLALLLARVKQSSLFGAVCFTDPFAALLIVL